MKRKNRLPKGWDQARVTRVIGHYESQSPGDAAAEDDAAFSKPGETLISVPTELVPEIQKLIDRRKGRG
jgi:hypothetical protein